MIFAAALSKEIDALGSDLFLLEMRFDSLYYNSSAESFLKGWLALNHSFGIAAGFS